MVKRIQSSRELNLLQYLNTPSMQYDPWNPSAPLLSIVNGEPSQTNNNDSGNEIASDSEDEEEPWAVLDPLTQFDAQPLATVEEALDFVMQLLQGLVFLHENRIVHGDIRRQVVMMDNGNPSIATGPGASRIQRDVKYFFVDFTHAVVVGDKAEYLFREDLRDLGLLISQALDDTVPELADLVVQMVDTETQRTSRLTTAKQMLDELEHVITDLTADRIKCPL
ncbi:hypothetical protein CPB86DRAFT_785568 [Serendipita vermifera]|nr:hypothetical protein CPB86DRAFT_785568 [Serendipita vermifera]